MNVFEKVQQTRPEIDGADDNISAARTRLLTEIHVEKQPARSRAARRPWFIAGGLLGAAAAVTAGVLVVSGMTAQTPTVEAVPTRAPMPTLEPTPVQTPAPVPATAPEVLTGAANAAAAFAPPVLAPGQYLRFAWTWDTLGVYEPAFGRGYPGYGGSRSSATSAWTIGLTGAYYAPADLHSQWYAESGAPVAGGVYGDEAQARAQQNEAMQESGPARPLSPMDAPRLAEGGAEDVLWYLETMPRDPDAMIAWIQERVGGPDEQGWADGRVGWLLVGLLSYNIGDPELRASMYQVLSRLPGSTVSAEQDGRRTVTFDSHLAYPDRTDLSLWRYTLTIEMSTGIVTETTSTTDAGLGTIPSDVPDSRVTYVISVVDALP